MAVYQAEGNEEGRDAVRAHDVPAAASCSFYGPPRASSKASSRSLVNGTSLCLVLAWRQDRANGFAVEIRRGPLLFTYLSDRVRLEHHAAERHHQPGLGEEVCRDADGDGSYSGQCYIIYLRVVTTQVVSSCIYRPHEDNVTLVHSSLTTLLLIGRSRYMYRSLSRRSIPAASRGRLRCRRRPSRDRWCLAASRRCRPACRSTTRSLLRPSRCTQRLCTIATPRVTPKDMCLRARSHHP
eukprot:COSAG06_NODE_8476_length_2158_cov_1.587178_2_plen_239_part_00